MIPTSEVDDRVRIRTFGSKKRWGSTRKRGLHSRRGFFWKWGLVLAFFVAAGAGFWGWKYFRLHLDSSWSRGVEGDLHWLGAETPTLVVHEFFDYECPHCLVSHKRLRRKLSRYPDRLRIVRHDYARMACAPNDAQKRSPRCQMARAAHCAGKRDKYWEWNDAVITRYQPGDGDTPKDFEIILAKEFGFDIEEFQQCLYAPATIAKMDAVFRDARKKRIKGVPFYLVNGNRMSSEEVLDFIEASLR